MIITSNCQLLLKIRKPLLKKSQKAKNVTKVCCLNSFREERCLIFYFSIYPELSSSNNLSHKPKSSHKSIVSRDCRLGNLYSIIYLLTRYFGGLIVSCQLNVFGFCFCISLCWDNSIQFS